MYSLIELSAVGKSLWKIGISVVLCISSSVVCDVRLSSGAFSLLSVCVVIESSLVLVVGLEGGFV